MTRSIYSALLGLSLCVTSATAVAAQDRVPQAPPTPVIVRVPTSPASSLVPSVIPQVPKVEIPAPVHPEQVSAVQPEAQGFPSVDVTFPEPNFGEPDLPVIHPGVPSFAPYVVPGSLLSLSDTELQDRVSTDPRSLGPLSIGGVGRGKLFNAVEMPRGERWQFGSNAKVWTTTETIASIESGIDAVHELFPDTVPLQIGDFSAEEGGRLKRHQSHQSGRDVDVGFYFKGAQAGHFFIGNEKNMDLPRTWTLLRAWLVRTDVDVVFLDRRIQKILYRYALGIGEDKGWLDHVFQYPGGRGAMVQHIAGHRNHFHVRFYNPVAQELGRRAYPLLINAALMDPPVFTVRHRVRAGQSMGSIAARYGTSVQAIMKANGLRSTQLRAGRSYKIPVRGTVNPAEAVVIPPRLLPPFTPAALNAIEWPTSAAAATASSSSSAADRH
jgi:LysM repeat protein/murein endopeptidase